MFVSICRETLRKSISQHLLLLVGFDTLIYRKYYDASPILVGHQVAALEFVTPRTRTTFNTPSHDCRLTAWQPPSS